MNKFGVDVDLQICLLHWICANEIPEDGSRHVLLLAVLALLVHDFLWFTIAG